MASLGHNELNEGVDSLVPDCGKRQRSWDKYIISIKWYTYIFLLRTWGLASWTWRAYGQTCSGGTLPAARTWQVTCRAPPRTPGGWAWETTAPNGDYGRGEETVWEVWKQSRKFDAKDSMGYNPNRVKKFMKFCVMNNDPIKSEPLGYSNGCYGEIRFLMNGVLGRMSFGGMYMYLAYFSVYATSQWKTALHCNAVSHWLSVCTEWSLNSPCILHICPHNITFFIWAIHTVKPLI